MKRILCAHLVSWTCLLGLVSLAAEASSSREAQATAAETTVETTASKIQGKVDGFGSLPRDDWADAAAVFPSLTENQILSFDFGALLAPDEPMKAGPMSTDVPGNVYVPRQSEKYGWIPVTLEKESFSIYLKAGEQNELFVISVKAPFNEAVRKAREKAPAAEIVKLMKFGKLGFAPAKDWSKERNANIALNQSRPKATNLKWTRSKASSSEADIVLNLEETPMSRWLISDLDADPKTSLRVSSTNFAGKAKLIFARSKFNSNDDLVWMRSWFPTHERPSQLQVEGIPAALEAVKWEDTTNITWTGGDKLGWATVFIEAPKTAPASDDEFLSIEALFLQNLVAPLRSIARPRMKTEWVRVEDGRITLSKAPAAKSTVSLVFLGGQRLTDSPNLVDAEELHVYNLTK